MDSLFSFITLQHTKSVQPHNLNSESYCFYHFERCSARDKHTQIINSRLPTSAHTSIHIEGESQTIGTLNLVI
jgi:hypothetical protein